MLAQSALPGLPRIHRIGPWALGGTLSYEVPRLLSESIRRGTLHGGEGASALLALPIYWSGTTLLRRGVRSRVVFSFSRQRPKRGPGPTQWDGRRGLATLAVLYRW